MLSPHKKTYRNGVFQFINKPLVVFFFSTDFQLHLGNPPLPPPLGSLIWGDPCLNGHLNSSTYCSIVFKFGFPLLHLLFIQNSTNSNFKVHARQLRAILVKGNVPRGIFFGWMATWQNVELSVHLKPKGRTSLV